MGNAALTLNQGKGKGKQNPGRAGGSGEQSRAAKGGGMSREAGRRESYKGAKTLDRRNWPRR